MRTKGSKNLRSKINAIEFEIMLLKEKLRMCDEFELELCKQIESLKFFAENIEKIIKEA